MTINHLSWPEAKEYFRDYSSGKVDEAGEFAFIYPQDTLRVSDDGEKLYIGRAGVGGIEFVYQRGSPEIWAYYPIDAEIQWKAESIGAFVRDWMAGEIEV